MKALTVIKYLFSAIGLALLVGAFYWYKSTQDFLANAIVAEGTVLELIRSRSSDSSSYTYAPVVQFRTESGSLHEFTSSTSSNPPSYAVGESVGVLYEASAPESARINSFFSLWGGPTIAGGLGAVFFTIGASIVLAGRLKGSKIQHLKVNGTPIKTTFQGVEINRSLRVNGRSPYRIVTQWKNPSTSELHLFESENIWFDPSDHINVDEITVLIERHNPKKYYVDISFLPKLSS
ncbi:MAG: DUF3592 domain-containing protein [Gammaproteobacteria bacterium]